MENERKISLHNLYQMENFVDELQALDFKFRLLMEYMPEIGMPGGVLSMLDELCGLVSQLSNDYKTLYSCVCGNRGMNPDIVRHRMGKKKRKGR